MDDSARRVIPRDCGEAEPVEVAEPVPIADAGRYCLPCIQALDGSARRATVPRGPPVPWFLSAAFG